MKSKIAGVLFALLIANTFIQAQTTQDLSIISIETVDENEFKGKITYQDSTKIVLTTKYLGPITIQKNDIVFMGVKNGFDEVRKNALSLNILGTSALLGITYERLLSQYVSAELGIGIIGVGAGIKIFPSKIKENKPIFHTGITGTYMLLLWDYAAVAYIPLGVSFFGKKGFNLGVDLDPALFMEGDGYNNLFPYGNLKFGFRF